MRRNTNGAGMPGQGKGLAAVVREADLGKLHSLSPGRVLDAREPKKEFQSISQTIRLMDIGSAIDIFAVTAAVIKNPFRQNQRAGRRIQQLPRAGIDGRERRGQHAGDGFVIGSRLTRT